MGERGPKSPEISLKGCWHGFCSRKSMKRLTFISMVLVAATLSFAREGLAAPESSIPTPAEKTEISQETPNLGAKESADWQKLRAERKQAREQILSRLRESSNVEKQNIRQDVSKNRNEESRFEGKNRKNEPRERRPEAERPERVDSPEMNPMRGMPGPIPPWWTWGPMHP